jgi:hypothetical protein
MRSLQIRRLETQPIISPDMLNRVTHAIALIMKAIETTGKIDDQGQLTLDRPLKLNTPNQVRIIVLVPENEVELEQNDWSTLSAEQFLNGYSATDAIYDTV